MNRFKISTRLLLLLGFVSLLLIIVGTVGIVGLARTKEALRSVYEDRTVCLGQLDVINRYSLENEGLLTWALVNPSAEKTAELLPMAEANSAQIDKVWGQYLSTYLTPDEKGLADAYAEARKAYRDNGVVPLKQALRKGDYAAAQLLAAKSHELYEPLRKTGNALVQLQLDEAQREYQLSAERYRALRLGAIVSMTLGVVLAVGMGLLLLRGIRKSLNYAGAVTSSVAAGDLTRVTRIEGNDEIAELLRSMEDMRRALVQVVSEVRAGVDSVSTASAQIAAGNHELSSRTEQQASSLEETAASMEEFTSTVKQTADNARQANQLASSASEAAAGGGQVVDKVVTTMEAITDASKKIADIIGVIDGIAFQTNILALNAAVEAARAGEQGRGFAVVAGEVRSLAQRSAQAAKEIKAVIGDSVDKVATGSQLVRDAGTSMKDIVQQVQRVNDLLSEITSATAEQSSGIGQINEAITQMDHVTQQNAALVEESSAAATSLESQAHKLAAVVSRFKLDAAVLARPAAAAAAVPAFAAPAAPAPSKAPPPKAAALPEAKRPGAATAPTVAAKVAAAKAALAHAAQDWTEF